MQQEVTDRLDSELKLKAIATGITELIGLSILLAYTISNITTQTENLETSNTDAFYTLTNEILTWLSGILTIIILVCTLFIAGAQKGKIWLMIPHIGVHLVAIVFFAISWLVLGIKLRDDLWLVLNVSMYAVFLIGFTSMILKPAIHYLIFIKLKREMEKNNGLPFSV